ncbi:MAG TPA: flagellar hook-basal body complex protein FliE [Phycisphaerales bacterium]|nr:flagellar hook-basal body complex protein FliE [Phycisphaerales bacterium]
MSDPLGFVSGAAGGGLNPVGPRVSGGEKPTGAPDFREVLLKNLQQVNNAQQDADRAVEDLMTGRRSDVEGVILATQKADNAFKMLQAMRGKVLQAYDEIKQVRV